MATNLTVSPQKAAEIMKRADSAMAKLNKIRGKTEEKVGEVFKMAETVGGALAVGAARAKWGEVTIGPDIPAEAALGAALSLAAFLDLPGKYSEHLHNVGNGILGGWSTLEAVKLGGGIVLSKEEYARFAASQPKTVNTSGEAVAEKDAPMPAPAKEKEINLLPPNGVRRTAREHFSGTEVREGQEVGKSSGES
jgi:hypothetical protein